MASTRLVVQCSTRASGRQLHRSQRNVGPSSASLVAPRGVCLHNTSFVRPTSGIHGATSRSRLSTDAAVLPAFESKTQGDGSSNGWSKWEILASTMLAVAATGSFLVGTTVSSPSFSPKIYHRGGGGGGSGGGGPSSGPPAAPSPKEKEETTEMVTLHDGPPYQVSARALQGGRLTMEDEFFVADGGRFAAVFDGHGGGGVSGLLKERLFKLIADNLRRYHDLEETSKRMCRPALSSYVAALRSAFQQIDNDILSDDSLQYQGSTAVAVLIHEGVDGHRTLLSANVGDSRAILSRNGRAVDLTRDHKPNDEKEKARIMAMGETIEWDHYCKVHRVKNLSLSRAIGDRFAKPVVTGEPEIKHFSSADESDEFILLASDGLWDVMTSQDVVSFVHQKLDGPTLDNSSRLARVRKQKMSTAVAKEALRRGSGDNVCVVIVWLDDDNNSTRSI